MKTKLSRVPDNVKFEIDDFEAKNWAYPENHFDFIHSRILIGSVSSWPRFLKKVFKYALIRSCEVARSNLGVNRYCRPGGYYEMQELNPRFESDDGSLKKDSMLSLWSQIIVEACEKYNRPLPFHNDYVEWFEKAGFVDVKQVILKGPSNPWPKDKHLKEVGKYQCVAHIEGLEGVSLALFTRAMKWKAEEVKVLMAKMRPELKSRSIHSYNTK